MINLTKSLFALWTRELRRWLSAKFDSISIDLTPVEEKLSEVKSGVADVQDALANLPKVDFQADRELIMGGVKGIDYAIQDVLAGYRFQQAFAFGDDFIPDERDVNIFPKVGDVLLFGFDAQHEGYDLYVITDYDKDAYERGDIWTALEDDSDRISQSITVANVERDSLWRVKEVLEDDGNNHILYIYEPVNLGVSTRELQERLRSMQGTSTTANLTTIHNAVGNINLAPVEDKLTEVKSDTSQGLTNQQTILGVLNGIATNMYKGVPVVAQMGDALISPNIWNVWESVGAALTITKGAEVSGVVNEYIVRLTCTADVAVTFSGWTLVWYGGNAPTFAAGKTYEISIIDNIALWAEF